MTNCLQARGGGKLSKSKYSTSFFFSWAQQFPERYRRQNVCLSSRGARIDH